MKRFNELYFYFRKMGCTPRMAARYANYECAGKNYCVLHVGDITL